MLSNLFKVFRKIVAMLFKYRFSKVGNNVTFDPFSFFSYSTISLGSNVYIGPNAHFSSPMSVIEIGSKVMFGPNVSILGGNHNTAIIGKYMFDVKDKLPSDDAPVIIGDDVWIGAGVIILKGVTIGSGSIVGAGSIVTKDIKPNSIVVGVPARKIKDRFSNVDLQRHEDLIHANNNK